MARVAMPSLSAAVLLRFDRSEGDPATRPLRVLLAEADPGRRDMLRAALEAAGDSALCVGSWDQALGELSRKAVDAAILALDLPKAGGLAAARVLRGWPAPVSGLPLLALHAGTARVQETAWREAGFDALLHWPAERAEMASLLRAVVVRLTPAEPLDRAQRAALREALGAEALAARDRAALVEAGVLLARLRAAPDAEAARAVAEALAEACRTIGAVAAAAAADAAAEGSARQFPPAIEPLMGALAAAGSAIRFEGRARR